MTEILFPDQYLKQRHGFIHIKFILDYLKRCKEIDIKLVNKNDKVFIASPVISILLNGKQVLINYSDFYYNNENYQKNVPVFKFHYYKKFHDKINNIFPIGTLIVNNFQVSSLDDFFSIRKEFRYDPGDAIMNKQIPRNQNVKRRNKVKKIIKENFEHFDLEGNDDQKVFWKKHENCLVAVCVPGSLNDMLDRGQNELMALGVCTISPKIKTILPYGKELIPKIDYIACANDYSDLEQKIKWCYENKDECKRIGDNARLMFDSFCVPEKYLGWLEKKTEEYYNGDFTKKDEQTYEQSV
jgi:hypothetical protein